MYDEIVRKYYTAILNYCRYKLNGSQTAAEDVTQEVFLVLHKKLHKLKLSENIKLWLYRTADREIKAYIRKNPSFVPIDECSDMVTEDSYTNIEDSCLKCLNNDEISLLSDYYYGDSKEDVAKSHNLNMNALYIRIHKIRNKLKVSLSESNKIKK